MTHEEVSLHRESAGSESCVYHEIDITSVDETTHEEYDPSAETPVGRVNGVSVVGQADPSYTILWDSDNSRLSVLDADGTETDSDSATSGNQAGSAVGRVTLRVTGD